MTASTDLAHEAAVSYGTGPPPRTATRGLTNPHLRETRLIGDDSAVPACGRAPASVVRTALLLALAGLLITGCLPSASDKSPPDTPQRPRPTSAAPRPSPSPTASPSGSASPAATVDAEVSEIGDAQWARITAAGVWREGCPVGRERLRRVSLDHWGFDGRVHHGVLIVHEDVAGSVVRIFTRLFEAHFPIRRMVSMEEYGGDDRASMRADNTSGFNCRRQGQANASPARSPHANGRAIDINPLENPWKDLRCTCWKPSPEHSERTPGKGKILKGGMVWRTFTDAGWIWQNIDTPDYQHFDTGFPSRPFADRPPADSRSPTGGEPG